MATDEFEQLGGIHAIQGRQRALRDRHVIRNFIKAADRRGINFARRSTRNLVSNDTIEEILKEEVR